MAERLEEAQAVVDSLGRAHPEKWEWTAWRARIAARRGDRETAIRYAQALAAVRDLYLFGRPTLARGETAALLGERDEAVRLLSDAIAQRQQFRLDPFHTDPDLDSLRGYAPYENLVHPKG